MTTIVRAIDESDLCGIEAEFPDGESCRLLVWEHCRTELHVSGPLTDEELNCICQKIINIKLQAPDVNVGLRLVAELFSSAPSLVALGRTLH